MKWKRHQKEVLYLPGEESWEAWSIEHGAIQPACTLVDAPSSSDFTTHVGLPVKFVHLLPYWIPTPGNDREKKDMLSVQLEKTGLFSSHETPEFHSELISNNNKERQAHLVATLGKSLPESLCSADFFDLALRYRPHPPGHITLTRELGQWVIVVKRGSALVIAQALLGSTPKVLAGEIRALILSLSSQGFIEGSPLTLWSDNVSWATALETELGTTIVHAKRPQPILPSPRWPLIPPAAKDRLETQKKSNQKNRIKMLLALAYLIVTLAIITDTFIQQKKLSSLKTKVEASMPTVLSLRQTANRWDLVEPALNPKKFPVELYALVYKCLPPDGVRLTLFDYNGGIQLAGEARNATLASSFYEELKKTPDLAFFNWKMVPPKILPNNTAQFQIAGGTQP